MRRWAHLLVLAALGVTGADDPKPGVDPAKDPREQALRETNRAFVTAFNAGDAKAVAALHTPDAHEIDQDGNAVEGRGAIEGQYADLFKASPGATIEVAVDGVHFFGPDSAVEDGSTRVTPKTGPPWVNRYSVIYTRRGGQWLIAGTREYSGEEPSASDRLKELGWMLGEWVDESEDSTILTTVKPSSDQAFLLRDYTIRSGGKVVLSGSQRVGWDPLSKQFKSWEFDSAGGHGEGLWARASADRWLVKARSVLPDGRIATATHVLTVDGTKGVRWKTVDRTVGGDVLPDITEFIMVRKPPAPK